MYRHRRLIHLLARSLPRDRLIATGAPVFLPTQVITMLSLVLYELGTNALKYGARIASSDNVTESGSTPRQGGRYSSR